MSDSLPFCTDARQVPLHTLQSRFGEESIWIYNLIRVRSRLAPVPWLIGKGIDETEVTSISRNKTMLASKNLIPPCTTPSDGLRWIDLLAGELNVRFLEARQLSPGLWPKTLVLKWRTGYGYGNNLRSRQAPYGFNKYSSPSPIVSLAKRLWAEACAEIKQDQGPMDVFSVSICKHGVSGRRRSRADHSSALTPVLRGRNDGGWSKDHHQFPWSQRACSIYQARLSISAPIPRMAATT